MDVTQSNDAANSANLVLDQVGVKCQKLLQDFLEEWQAPHDLYETKYDDE